MPFLTAKIARPARAVLVALGFASLFTAAQAQNETVTYAQPGSVGIWLAPHSFGKELGLFTDEKIDLDIILLSGSGEVIPQLVKGSIQVSTLTPDVLTASKQPGKPNFPLHFAYNVYRESFWQLAVLDTSPIKTIADMKDKTVGVGALTFANVLQTKALLRRQGVDPASVSFIAVGSGGAAVEALRSGKIDVLNHVATLTTTLELQGVKIRRLAYPEPFGTSSSHGLVFSDATIEKRPDLVAKFGRAYARATVACQANPTGCLRAYWKVYPAAKPTPFDDAAQQRELKLLNVLLAIMTDFPAGTPRKFGAYNDQDWLSTIEALRVGGEIQGAGPAPSSLYTGKFVDEFNKFDMKATVDRAKAY